MSKISSLSRRQFLVSSVGAAAALSAGKSLAQSVLEACGLTPPQTAGPFYPVEDQLDKDTDLTQVTGHFARAKGQVIYILGRVQDEACAPIQNARVEIWQACASGRYHHPDDNENPAPLDPDFQYWGQALSGPDGTYRFKTIIPGSYPAGPGWIRPPHVHFKVARLGFHDLITQMYFAGQSLNAADKILDSLTPGEQSKVIVALTEPNGGEFERASKVCHFDITLRRP